MYEVLLFASVVIFAAVCTAYARQEFSSIYHPVTLYLAFHGLVFVVRPIAAYHYGYNFLYRGYAFLPSPEVKATVIVAANLGLLAFVAGAWRTGSEPLQFKQNADSARHRERLLGSFVVVLALLGPVALASLLTIFQVGYAGMRLDPHTGTVINTTGNGWLTDAQMMLVTISVLIAWIFRFRWWSLLPLVGFVVIRAGTGGRGPFVVACVAAAMLWLFDRRRRWPSPRVIALGLALFALFYVIGQSRSFVRDTLDTGEIASFQQHRGVLETMDFANLEFFEYLVNTIPEKTGTYGYFVDTLQIFTEPIPRKLWPSKPIGPPIRLFNIFDYGNPIGLTQSLPGYGWVQLGYAGVVIWCGLWGLALGAVYSRFAGGRQGNFAVAAYFAFLPLFVVAYRDGGIVTIARTGVFYLTPVLAWMIAARALGIPDPADFAPSLAGERNRRGRPNPVEPELQTFIPRSRRQQEDIVPRAWRRRMSQQATR